MINVLITVGVVFVILLAIYFLLKFISIERMKPHIVKFITYAEKLYSQGDNEAKFHHVYSCLYNMLPSYVRAIFSEKALEKIIQDVFDAIKVALDYRPEEGGEKNG